MKKTFLFISAFSLLFSACEKKEPKKDPPSPTVSVERVPNSAEMADASVIAKAVKKDGLART